MTTPTIIKLDQAALAEPMRALHAESMKWVQSWSIRDGALLVDGLKRLWAAGLPGECPVVKGVFLRDIGGADTGDGRQLHRVSLQGKDGSDVPVRVSIEANEKWGVESLEIEHAIKVKVPVPTRRLESISIDLSDDFVVYEFESDRPPPREIEDRDWDDYLVDLDDEDGEDEAGDLDGRIEKARAELERLEATKATRSMNDGPDQ